VNDINILVLISIIFGIICIIISFLLKDKSEIIEEEQYEFEEVNPKEDNNINKEDIINEVNDKILELNDYSNFIKKELNDKHKELLFLYQLINEKETNIKKIAEDNLYKEETPKNKEPITIFDDLPLDESVDNKIKDQNNQILSLYKEGYNVTEIAKALNVGKGEIKLILDLYK
jgi:hypothetical protein